MDRIKAKLEALRVEADTAINRAEEFEAKCKKLEQALLEKENEVHSLTHRLSSVEEQNDKYITELQELKAKNLDSQSSLKGADNLIRKVTLLEEELDQAERNVKDTTEKLRQVDSKAEMLERQIKGVEAERDAHEAKYQALKEKYEQSQKDLAELEQSLAGL